MSIRPIKNGTTLCGFLVLLVLSICGCGESPNSGGAVALKFNIQLETPSLASQVEVVTLTIRYGGGTPIGPDTLNYEDGVIDDTLSVVPGDSVVFILRALNGTGLVLYEGRDTVGVVQPGSTLTIDITLRPAVLMLRAGPLIQEVELPEQSLIDVFVDVYNVDSLFGASFRAHYDTTILEFAGVVEGDFLKSAGPPPISTFAFLIKDSADFVAYSVTRLRESSFSVPGVSTGTTPGRLATLRFSKKRVGTSEITFAPTAQLVDPNGRLVRNHGSIVLEPATVRIVPN